MPTVGRFALNTLCAPFERARGATHILGEVPGPSRRLRARRRRVALLSEGFWSHRPSQHGTGTEAPTCAHFALNTLCATFERAEGAAFVLGDVLGPPRRLRVRRRRGALLSEGFWSQRPKQYGTGMGALRGDTHCVHRARRRRSASF